MSPDPRHPRRICAGEDCTRPVRAKGYCSACYQRLRRHGPVTDPRPAPCVIPGCLEPARSRRMCLMHYHRWYRTGDPGEATSSYGTTACQEPDCARAHMARGYCATHYKSYADLSLCKRRDCDQPPIARVLCRRHYNQLWALGLLTERRERHPERNAAIRQALAEGTPAWRVAQAHGLTPAMIYYIGMLGRDHPRPDSQGAH